MTKPYKPDPAFEFIDIALDAFAAMPEGPAKDAIQERIEELTLRCADEDCNDGRGYPDSDTVIDDYGHGLDCTVSYSDQDGGEVGWYYSVRDQELKRY